MTNYSLEKSRPAASISKVLDRRNITPMKKSNRQPRAHTLQNKVLGLFIFFVLLIYILGLPINMIKHVPFGLQNHNFKTHHTNFLIFHNGLNRIFVRNMQRATQGFNPSSGGGGGGFWKTLKRVTGTSLQKTTGSQIPLTASPPYTQHTQSLVSPEKQQTRDMGIWRTYKRSSEPIKGKYPPMEKDPITGYEIMHAKDYSGFNHILLNDHEYKSPIYLIVHGSFTTSPSPLNGNKPVFIDSITLEGQKKYQYFHVYPKPLLLRISDTAGMDFTTMFLPPQAKMDAIIAETRKMQEAQKIKDAIDDAS